MDYFVIGSTPENLKELSPAQFREKDELRSKIVFIELTPDSLKLLKGLDSNQHHNTKYVYYSSKQRITSFTDWSLVFNKFTPFYFMEFNSAQVNSIITKAKEEILEFDQEEEFLKLKAQSEQSTKSQINDLNLLSKKLLRSRQRTLQKRKNEQLNLNCIEVIFDSENVSMLEERLSEILNKSLSILWLRILTNSAEILTDLPTIKYQNQFETLIYEVEMENNTRGRIVFAKKKSDVFKKDEVNICQNISDALSLRIKQIITEQKIKNIKQQWSLTFNAIPFKTALISKDYDIIKVGEQFKKTKPFDNVKCYKYFWGRNKPCTRCKLGENFLIDHKNESLEVNSKKIFDPTTEENFYLNFYRDFDVSTSKESSKESLSKLEELGLICGSIAHELNNPLGGIKILLDLIKEDPDAQSKEDQEDIEILKKSTQHCISTVRELLKFTRKQADDNDSSSLRENIHQVKIFTRAFLQSSGFELQICESEILNQQILSKNSTLTIRLLEMVSQFVTKVSQSKSRARDIYLISEIKGSMLSLSLSSQKTELRQDVTHQLQPALYLDPTKVELKEDPLKPFEDTLSFHFTSQ